MTDARHPDTAKLTPALGAKSKRKQASQSVQVQLGILKPRAGIELGAPQFDFSVQDVALITAPDDVLAFLSKNNANGLYRLLVVPGEAVLSRVLLVSGETPAQREAAARFLLRDELASQPRDVDVRVGPQSGDGSAVTVCVLSTESKARWLAAAQAEGFQPDRIVPDHFLLMPPAPDLATVTPAVNAATDGSGRVMLAFADRLCTVEADLAELLCLGHTVNPVEVGMLWQASGIRAGLDHGIDLRATLPAAFSPLGLGHRWFRVAAGVCACAFLVGFWPWIEGFGAQSEAKAIRANSASVAQSALGPNRRIANPRAQIAEALADKVMSDDQLARAEALLLAVAQAQPAVGSGIELNARSGAQIELKRLQILPDGMVRLLLTVHSKEHLVEVRRALDSSLWPLREVEGSTIGGKVTIELTLEPRPAPKRSRGYP